MKRFRLLVLPLALFTTTWLAAQGKGSMSDQQALTLAAQSVNALTGGSAISDVTLNANVVSIPGSDQETGTGTFLAKGQMQSRMDLALSSRTLTEVRGTASGGQSGAWSKNGGPPMAQAGCNILSDAVWFFPALSSLAQFGNSGYLFKYIGHEQYNGLSAEHIQVSLMPSTAAPDAQRLSTMDFYLNSSTFLPLAMSFQTHPDQDSTTNIPVEIRFASYQAVGGVQIPFHFQRLLGGALVLDATVTTSAVNTSVPDSTFTLQ